ncbi:hypothetical protein [Phocaeicola dorei]|uniref:hypothetical protein n=1 Tax=Phocaeicola dorei TaxID=357276 RepID=UPI0034A45A46
MQTLEFLAYILRKLYRCTHKSELRFRQYHGYIEVWNQEANDYCYNLIDSGKPCMISKFGTVELASLQQCKISLQNRFTVKDYIDFIKCIKPGLKTIPNISLLCNNAGFFPNDTSLLKDFYHEYVKSMKEIDVLGSYIYGEKDFSKELNNAKKINIEGYYYPFFFKNPWTKLLKHKKVLVIHPFAEDIQNQYLRKELIWGNIANDILPEFTLITYKAVQSMLGIKTEFNNWFEALEKMKNDISNIDFDIALIGCGAYGMPLAAFIKKLGKQSVHLAGCTQILFGIIGKRWQDLPTVSKYINSYWIHPSSNNIPSKYKKIENGCYW